jgi:hypothetical protein
MKDDDFSTEDFNELKESETRFFQIDILKAIMIFLVIFDHTVPWALKSTMGVALWERISIPVFLVIMGFNMGKSFRQSGETSLRKLYSWKYVKKKFWRYLFPFLILYGLSTFIGLAINGFDLSALTQFEYRFDLWHLIIGILPFYGPGNWFLPVVFWSILIMPLLYKGFSGKKYWSIISLGLCYIVELAVRATILFVVIPNVSSGAEFDLYFRFIYTSPFFLLSAIGLGLWLSRDHDIYARKNYFMGILFGFSLFYILLYQFFGLYFGFEFGDYHLLIFPYSAFLVLLALNFIPKRVNDNHIIVKGIKLISNSTYHILLTQILYFGITISLYTDHYGASIFGIDLSYELLTVLGYLVINWVICVPIGCLWWYGENRLRKYRRTRKNL